MVRILTVDDVRSLIHKVTLETFFVRLIEQMEKDFSHWQTFQTIPRLASHFEYGVIELMPICDQNYYSYKYINGHPGNPEIGKQTVVGVGMLADVRSGYPVLISEMTLLTALRTAGVSALASRYLARKDSKTMGIIGCGAQSEFQVIAHHECVGIQDVYYFDIDRAAMKKFSENLSKVKVNLYPCSDGQEVVKHADIVTSATAAKIKAVVIKDQWVSPGLHINGIGGDCPGKTELAPEILKRAKIVVELLDQSRLEGEIQNLAIEQEYAELWEIVSGEKPGRVNSSEITLFDSVGFALEDYSILRLMYRLAEDFHVGHLLDMIPQCADPKNLFSILN